MDNEDFKIKTTEDIGKIHTVQASMNSKIDILLDLFHKAEPLITKEKANTNRKLFYGIFALLILMTIKNSLG